MKHILLDCDPGHDDFLAIILALGSPELTLVGITSTAGNVSIERTTLNVRRALAIANRHDIPVGVGAARPLIRPPRICDEIHGESGLGGYDFSLIDENLPPITHSALDLMRESALKYDNLYFCGTGALTNIALFAAIHPGLFSTLAGVSVMGGAARGFGNTRPTAEFNVEIDPHAWQMVIDRCNIENAKVPFTWVPLECTHTMLASERVLEKIQERTQPGIAEMVIKLLTFFKDTYRDVFGLPDPPVHDPGAILAISNPELFEIVDVRVDVELGSELTYGTTVVDWFRLHGKSPNSRVCMAVDVEAFWDKLINALDQCNV